MVTTSPSISHFSCKVAGVSFSNLNGSSRQAAIQSCQPSEHVLLQPEPDNPEDPNAIAVRRRDGKQLGYLPAWRAVQVQKQIQFGDQFEAYIWDVLGTTPEYPMLGVVLFVLQMPAGTDHDTVAYIDSLWPNQPAAS